MLPFETLTPLEQDSISRAIPILKSKKGKWLYDFVSQHHPEKVLELGTANGYSGCILGSTGAKLLTLEKDARIAAEAIENFAKHKIVARVVICDAVQEVERLAKHEEFHKSFDIIFLDFAKKQYIDVLENCVTLLKVGGFLIADNITFLNCQDYRARIKEHSQLKTEFILVSDGLSCSQKISSH